MLKISNVTTHYGPIRALNDVTMEVAADEIVCLLAGRINRILVD